MEYDKLKACFSREGLFQISIQLIYLCGKCFEIGFIDAPMLRVDLLQRAQNGAGLDLH